MSEPDPPQLSVVVVNWNTCDLLLRLLGQLLPPGGPPFPCEVIVVDNDSSDGSADAARSEFPGAVVLPQPRNGGFAYGVNRGLQRAKSPFVLLLNTDAEADWERIGLFLAEARAHPQGAVFGPRITDQHGRLQPSHWRAPTVWGYLPQALFLHRLLQRNAGESSAPRGVDAVSGCVFLVRRQALREVGGMDERFFMYFEETDLCARIRARGHQVMLLPGTTFVHQGGVSAGQAAARTFLAFRESCLLYHAVWHGRLETEWIRLCLLLGALLRGVLWLPATLTGRRSRAGLHWRAIRMLARPGLVAGLARRPRAVPLVT